MRFPVIVRLVSSGGLGHRVGVAGDRDCCSGAGFIRVGELAAAWGLVRFTWIHSREGYIPERD